MAKCTVCISRKGKRKCKATGTFICSLCCGTSRKEAKCDGCSFFKSASIIQNYRRVPYYRTQEMADNHDLESIANLVELSPCQIWVNDHQHVGDGTAARLVELMVDLRDWLAITTEHPLVASCVFHYEFEFIHPFADGNGRMGRLWQTLILLSWKDLLAYLPVETVILDRQEDYYRVVAVADQQADTSPFIVFMLCALLDALREAVVTDQVAVLIRAIGTGELDSNDLMQTLGLSHRPTFRENYLNPALEDDWIERTQPDSPRSPTQGYRLTGKGRRWLQHNVEE